MGIFSEYAYKYYNLGMNVMPVIDRKPIVKDFNNLWHANRQSEDELDMMLEYYGHCNGIAMICGAFGTVLDVDTITDHAGLNALVPPTPMRRFGSKGMGHLYAGVARSKRVAKGIPLELFGTGYVVLPPSYHPATGKHYAWVDSQFCAIEDLPVFPIERWDVMVNYCLQNGILKQGISNDTDFSSPGAGRNTTLAGIIWNFAHNPYIKSLPFSQIVDKIMQADRDRHPNNPWFEDKEELSYKTPTPRKLAEWFTHYHLTRAAKKHGTVIVDADKYVEPAPVIEIIQPRQSTKAIGLIPRGGIMEEVHKFVTKANRYENELLSLSGALSMCSILGSHRVVVDGAHPNLFVLCTGTSGIGKSGPQRAVKDGLLCSANGSQLLGFESYSSAQTIAHGLATNRRRIDIIDECKSLFKGNAKQQGHLQGAAEELCKIFTESANFLPGKSAINKESRRAALQNPYLSLMMYSTPEAFYDYFSGMLANEGFGGRCIYLADDTKVGDIVYSSDDEELVDDVPGETVVNPVKYSTHALEAMNRWLTMPIKYVDKATEKECAYNETGGVPQCHKIAVSAAVKKAAREARKYYNSKSEQAKHTGAEDHYLHACYLRAIEQCNKLMGCLVVSQYDENYMLRIEDWDWAHKVVELSFSSLLGLVKKSELAGSEGELHVSKYKWWARDKIDISASKFNEWVRRTVKSTDLRKKTALISTLEAEGLGHWEQSDDRSANSRVRTKWVFTIE